MRLFVALALDDGPRRVLERTVDAVAGSAPRVRWTAPASWHVTLAFLGEVEALGAVVDAVTPVAAAHDRPALHLGGVGRFGRRVVWAAVDDAPGSASPGPGVAALAADVRAGAVDAGLLTAGERWRGHVTLARARRGPGAEVDAGLEARLAAALDTEVARAGGPGAVRWEPSAIEVWRSRRSDGPVRYEVVASVPLGASAG